MGIQQMMLMAHGASTLLAGTLTPATNGVATGYSIVLPGSSMTTSSLSNGGSVISWADSGGTSILQVSIGSNPGQTHFTNAIVGGIPKTSASALYSYSGGIAEWQWASAFGFSAGVPTTVSITR